MLRKLLHHLLSRLLANNVYAALPFPRLAHPRIALQKQQEVALDDSPGFQSSLSTSPLKICAKLAGNG